MYTTTIETHIETELSQVQITELNPSSCTEQTLAQTVDTINQKSHLSHILAATIFGSILNIVDSNKILLAVPSVLYGNIPGSACAWGPGTAPGRNIWAASFSFRLGILKPKSQFQ